MEHIAVIGAGMAGLTATRMLCDAGLSVSVFDKSRGVGGRLAKRRSEAGAFNHGAPIVQGRDIPGFDAAMGSLPSARARGDGWIGLPGMSGLLKPWLEGVRHYPGLRIVGIEGRALHDEAGGRHGPFDAVVVAIPAPQAADLTGQAGLKSVVMDPVWTVMAAWDSSVCVGDPVAPFDKIVPQDGDGGARIVAHANVDWSRAHLEIDKPTAAALLASSLADALDTNAPPLHLAAHRWRFARTAMPLGQPFLDCGSDVLAGGDWALGPLAGHAYASGAAMATEIQRRALPSSGASR